MGDRLNFVQVRQACPADKEEMLAISAQIWDGDDYLPRVVDTWLAQEGGEFSVALLDGRIVGFSKLSELLLGHGWLQGARVDVNIQGRGIGRALTQHHIDLAKTRGFKSLRMVTDSDNTASRTLAERIGFYLAGEYFRHVAQPYSPTEAEGVADIPNYYGLPPAPANGIVSAGWTFFPYEEELMKDWSQQKRFYGTGEVGMAMFHGNRPERVNIPMLWGPPQEVAKLLTFARKQPQVVERINCIVCDDRYNQVLAAAGYSNIDEHTMVVYEYKL